MRTPVFVRAVFAACVLLTGNSAFPALATPAEQSDYANRALRVYQDVISGRRSLESLTPQERQMFFMVRRSMRRRGFSRKPDCQEALDQVESAADDLADSTRRLLLCVEGGDLRDDCTSEFDQVRSAHDDYESAVSEVESNCD